MINAFTATIARKTGDIEGIGYWTIEKVIKKYSSNKILRSSSSSGIGFETVISNLPNQLRPCCRMSRSAIEEIYWHGHDSDDKEVNLRISGFSSTLLEKRASKLASSPCVLLYNVDVKG